MPAGSQFFVKARTADAQWVRIETPDGVTGWIDAKATGLKPAQLGAAAGRDDIDAFDRYAGAHRAADEGADFHADALADEHCCPCAHHYCPHAHRRSHQSASDAAGDCHGASGYADPASGG